MAQQQQQQNNEPAPAPEPETVLPEETSLLMGVCSYGMALTDAPSAKANPWTARVLARCTLARNTLHDGKTSGTAHFQSCMVAMLQFRAALSAHSSKTSS
jgi:hypothetical protein